MGAVATHKSLVPRCGPSGLGLIFCESKRCCAVVKIADGADLCLSDLRRMSEFLGGVDG